MSITTAVRSVEAGSGHVLSGSRTRTHLCHEEPLT
jgi:hypothetical protein